ncbi:MAG: oligosaccharide flippase family protein [Caldilineaceae bacterium]
MSTYLRVSAAQRTLLGNIGALLSGTLLARGLGMVGIVVLARTVGPAAYGYLASSLVVAKLAAVFFSLGLDHWLLRYGGRAQDEAALAKHSTSCLVLKLGLGGLWWLVLVLVASGWTRRLFPDDLAVGRSARLV